jgi:hypothetical protein
MLLTRESLFLSPESNRTESGANFRIRLERLDRQDKVAWTALSIRRSSAPSSLAVCGHNELGAVT